MKLSIITSNYNREDCIARCIKSVKANIECGAEIEHIIVDDGSYDNSVRIIQDYADDNDHIVFIRFKENQGTNAARNAAISAATGDYCIILDSDDYFVDDALEFISNTILNNEGFRYYMFAPDDMQVSYINNAILNNSYQSTLTYRDFLKGSIQGDFIHVVDTNVIKSFPFCDYVRIHEGVFFLRFYREVQKMLFTNRVVTIRERNRADSVTRETIRTEKEFIMRIIAATELYIDWFADDLIKENANDMLYHQYLLLLDNCLLVSDYNRAKAVIGDISKKYHVPFFLLLIYKFRLSAVYRLALQTFLFIKYRVLKVKVK